MSGCHAVGSILPTSLQIHQWQLLSLEQAGKCIWEQNRRHASHGRPGRQPLIAEQEGKEEGAVLQRQIYSPQSQKASKKKTIGEKAGTEIHKELMKPAKDRGGWTMPKKRRET
jgi:hypothetical protein